METTRRIFQMAEWEFGEANEQCEGACLVCGEFQGGCEPDARNYRCESCGALEVYGLEELLLMGRIELV